VSQEKITQEIRGPRFKSHFSAGLITRASIQFGKLLLLWVYLPCPRAIENKGEKVRKNKYHKSLKTKGFQKKTRKYDNEIKENVL